MARAIDNHQTPAFFVRGPSPMARLVFFSALSFALMVTDSRLNYLIEVRQGMVGLMQPMQALANMPSQLSRTIQSYFSTQKTLLKENAKPITGKFCLIPLNCNNFNSLSQENAHLRQLLGAAQTFSQPAKVAEILHTGRDPFTHKVMVNVGSRQEVVAGQAVVDGHGVIGQVTRIYPYSSEVTLITDKDLAIPVQGRAQWSACDCIWSWPRYRYRLTLFTLPMWILRKAINSLLLALMAFIHQVWRWQK